MGPPFLSSYLPCVHEYCIVEAKPEAVVSLRPRRKTGRKSRLGARRVDVTISIAFPRLDALAPLRFPPSFLSTPHFSNSPYIIHTMLRSMIPTLRTSVLARRTFVSSSIARESPLDSVKQAAENLNKAAGDAAAKGESPSDVRRVGVERNPADARFDRSTLD